MFKSILSSFIALILLAGCSSSPSTPLSKEPGRNGNPKYDCTKEKNFVLSDWTNVQDKLPELNKDIEFIYQDSFGNNCIYVGSYVGTSTDLSPKRRNTKLAGPKPIFRGKGKPNTEGKSPHITT